MAKLIRLALAAVMEVVIVTLVVVVAAATMPARSASTGPSSMPSSLPNLPEREMTPEEKAKIAFNAGVRAVSKADKYAASADKASDARKKEKAAQKANERYADARGKFEQVVQLAPTMPEAWNYLGYTRRKLGDYDAALAAYDQALALKPSFAEAIEYRGEAYLRMKRLDDAKAAYLDLFSSNRKLADKLLDSMKSWVDAQRRASDAGVEEFAKWVQERSQIAGQTTALTRAGAGSSWP
ncbi:MAG TPA: tetratricopeptide repeat protein [Steroidobacteraceae bacterium]|nr:tetratricopeptide repeat protein [Steroidobacteraceae bacterium]